MTPRSTRLRPDVSLYAVADGHVLRADGTHHHVHLGPGDADALLDALLAGGPPATDLATSALDSLVDAGLVDPARRHLTVAGAGLLAGALRRALERMGADVRPGGSPVVALDEPDPEGDPSPAGAVCWIDDHLVVLAPPAVPARDVAARRRAATRHRDTDPRTRALRHGRCVAGALSPAGLELAAAVVAAELLRRERPAYQAVVVDLHALTITRRPVLPLPPAPR